MNGRESAQLAEFKQQLAELAERVDHITKFDQMMARAQFGPMPEPPARRTRHLHVVKGGKR